MSDYSPELVARCTPRPKVFVHHTTKNKSFLKMYAYLRDRGIKNNKFFLALYDTSLLLVDPHDPKLTVEQKSAVRRECEINPWYYFREVCRVPVPGGKVSFELHIGNLSQIFLLLQNLNVIEILPRQNGKTIGAVCVFSYIYELVTENSAMIFSNKELADSQLNLKRYKEIVELLPSYLRRTHSNDKNNINMIESVKSKNSIKALSTGRDRESADKLGRGLTVPLMWFDEFAFLKFNNEIYESATFALSAAAERARAQGKPFFKLITTTPNNIDLPSGAYCRGMIDSSCPFFLEMFDMDENSLRTFINKNSDNGFVFIEFSYIQLGKDKYWFQEQCRAVNHVKLKIKREILLEWTKSADKSIYSEEQIDAISAGEKEVIFTKFVLNDYPFHFIEPYNPLKPYVLGIDVAGGVSLDSSTIVAVDPDTLSPVGYFANNKIELPEFADLIRETLITLFPMSAIAIERAPISLSVISTLMKDSFVKKRMVYTYQNDDTKEKEKSVRNSAKQNSSGSLNSRVYGLVTSETTRNVMYDLLNYEIVNHPEVFKLRPLIKEIATLERNKRGKIEAASGRHDDTLMGYLVARYAISYVPMTSKIITGNNKETAGSISAIGRLNNKAVFEAESSAVHVSANKNENIIRDRKKASILNITNLNKR